MTGRLAAKSTSPSTRGREIAQLFRRSRDLLETRACNLDGILEEADLEVVTSRSDDPGYAAVLLRLRGGGGGIMMAANQSPERRRFSLAHEIGHYFIPSHADAGPALACADADLRARSTDSKKLEWEANDFAAELLMPRALFSADAKHRPISFETVDFLAAAEMYQVSRTAAAWRLIQTTREQCALVMSRAGAVEWVAKSDTMAFWIPERGQAVGRNSVAAAIYRGESPTQNAERVTTAEWLEPRPYQSFDGIETFESACAIPSQSQVLSLIWARALDDDEDE
ncbi:MAG: ImmA/IrrE family metallo-endopeptidase [Gemmatimonadota bacterium]